MAGALALLNASGGLPVNIDDTSGNDNSISPAHATASYQLASSGVAQRTVGGVMTPLTNQWLISGSAGSYTGRAHVNSGTPPNSGSALDSDLALSSTRTWSLVTSGVSSPTCVLLITIKLGGVTVDTCLVTLLAVEA